MGPLKETLDSGDSEGSMSGARKLEVWMFGSYSQSLSALSSDLESALSLASAFLSAFASDLAGASSEAAFLALAAALGFVSAFSR